MRMKRLRPSLAKLFSLLCATLPTTLVYSQMPVESTNYTSSSVYQIGKASFYGGYFNGRKTANGEIFNENKLTAAHRTLPFGTVLKVTRLDNHQSVIVTVNDRGPYVGNRVLDLSKSAAREIGMIDKGVSEVIIETISMGKPNMYPESEPFAMVKPTKPAHKTKKREVKDDPRKGLIPEEYAEYSRNVEVADKNAVPELIIEDGIILEGSDRKGAFKRYSQNEVSTNEPQAQTEMAVIEAVAYTPQPDNTNLEEELAAVEEIVNREVIAATSNYVNPISYRGGEREEGVVLPYQQDFEGKSTASGEVYYGWDYTVGHSSYPFGTMLKVKRKSNGYSVIVKVNDRVGTADKPIFYLSKAAAESLELAENGGGADVIVEPITLEEIASMTVSSATPETTTAQADVYTNSVYQHPQTTEVEEDKAYQQIAQAHDEYVKEEEVNVNNIAHFSSENVDNEGFGLKIASFTDVKNALQTLEQIANRGYDKLLVQSDIANNELNFYVLAGPFSSKDEAMYYKSQLAGAKITSNVIFLEPVR